MQINWQVVKCLVPTKCSIKCIIICRQVPHDRAFQAGNGELSPIPGSSSSQLPLQTHSWLLVTCPQHLCPLALHVHQLLACRCSHEAGISLRIIRNGVYFISPSTQPGTDWAFRRNLWKQMLLLSRISDLLGLGDCLTQLPIQFQEFLFRPFSRYSFSLCAHTSSGGRLTIARSSPFNF